MKERIKDNFFVCEFYLNHAAFHIKKKSHDISRRLFFRYEKNLGVSTKKDMNERAIRKKIPFNIRNLLDMVKPCYNGTVLTEENFCEHASDVQSEHDKERKVINMAAKKKAKKKVAKKTTKKKVAKKRK